MGISVKAEVSFISRSCLCSFFESEKVHFFRNCVIWYEYKHSFFITKYFFCDSMLIHIRNVKIYMLKKNECTVVEEEAWIFFIWKKNLDEIKLSPIIGLIDPLSTRIGHVEILCFAHRIQQLIPELSNFTMGTISGMGFAQAQVHTNHSTAHFFCNCYWSLGFQSLSKILRLGKNN